MIVRSFSNKAQYGSLAHRRSNDRGYSWRRRVLRSKMTLSSTQIKTFKKPYTGLVHCIVFASEVSIQSGNYSGNGSGGFVFASRVSFHPCGANGGTPIAYGTVFLELLRTLQDGMLTFAFFNS